MKNIKINTPKNKSGGSLLFRLVDGSINSLSAIWLHDKKLENPPKMCCLEKREQSSVCLPLNGFLGLKIQTTTRLRPS